MSSYVLNSVDFYASATVITVPEAFCFGAVHVCVRDRVLKSLLTRYLINCACGNLPNLELWCSCSVQLGTKMNRLDFEVKGLKVMVTVRQHMVKYSHFGRHLFTCRWNAWAY